MLSFREWLNEMKVIEGENTYFILPTDVRKINQDTNDIPRNISSLERNKVLEKYKIEEILECMKYFFLEHKNGKNSFVVALRKENLDTLEHLNIDSSNLKDEIIDKILSKLQPTHFRYTSIENEKVAYVFGINVFDKKFRSLNADKKYFKSVSTIYIKIQFIFKSLNKEFKDLLTKSMQNKLDNLKNKLEKAKPEEVKKLKDEYEKLEREYSIDYVQNKLRFRSPSDINGKYTLIYPTSLICDDISIHKDR